MKKNIVYYYEAPTSEGIYKFISFLLQNNPNFKWMSGHKISKSDFERFPDGIVFHICNGELSQSSLYSTYHTDAKKDGKIKWYFKREHILPYLPLSLETNPYSF